MTSTLMTTALAIVGTLLGSALTALVTARIERRKNEALEAADTPGGRTRPRGAS
ncbi:hypothetical protein JTP77_011640 [Streptomyces sp. S9]|nr:hypothetical protein [Streptomyces sp. S9]